MKCDVCHAALEIGVCTESHSQEAIRRWMAGHVDGDGYRRPSSPTTARNVERVDTGSGVTLLVTGYANHTVQHAELLAQMCGFGALPPRPAGPTLYGRIGMPDLGMSEPPISMCPRCAVRLNDVFEEPWCPKCAWTPALAVSR